MYASKRGISGKEVIFEFPVSTPAYDLTKGPLASPWLEFNLNDTHRSNNLYEKWIVKQWTFVLSAKW